MRMLFLSFRPFFTLFISSLLFAFVLAAFYPPQLLSTFSSVFFIPSSLFVSSSLLLVFLSLFFPCFFLLSPLHLLSFILALPPSFLLCPFLISFVSLFLLPLPNFLPFSQFALLSSSIPGNLPQIQCVFHNRISMEKTVANKHAHTKTYSISSLCCCLTSEFKMLNMHNPQNITSKESCYML